MKFFFYPFLFVLSLLYRGGLVLDRFFKSRAQTTLSRPVLSIGNITVGGTGKTPLLLKLASDLKNMNIRPAVLTRGYRGFMESASLPFTALRLADSPKPDFFSTDGNLAPPNLSDEVSLMLEKLSDVAIGVGGDRASNAKFISKRYSPDVFILDDGFQHWSLSRAADIVCVDATDAWGAGALLPLGRLREPISGLKRATSVVMTRTDLVSQGQIKTLEDKIRKINPAALILHAEMRPQLLTAPGKIPQPMSMISGKKAVALSAVGRPQAFEESLSRHGAQVLPLRFRDHHFYSESDLDKAEALLEKSGDVLITTEKDWVKLSRMRWGKEDSLPNKIYLWAVEAVFTGNDEKRWHAFLEDCVREA